MERTRLRLEIGGTVQGLGFRPFVYRLARELGLAGWVRNSAAGASLEVEGRAQDLDIFLRRLREEKPPRANFSRLETRAVPLEDDRGFEILASLEGERSAIILPDLATCADCLAEILDPADRRHRYPFANCTRCGPRYSIVESLPYDRANTAMRNFAMCRDCRTEYEDPRDRRFHAQPIACPRCGPQLALWDAEGKVLSSGDMALGEAAAAIVRGEILALKGLGGFHLLADARSDAAVGRLRRRKAREEKPFAVLFPDLEWVRACARPEALESEWLRSQEAPIVLLRKREPFPLSKAIAPENPLCGALLPYTPLHCLLMRELGFPVVATSGNRSEEPLCIQEGEALERLRGIADLFLVHDRPIARPVDDSILRVMAGRETVLRRARGFAPLPVSSPASGVRIAVGAHLKGTVALQAGGQVFLSQHLGDLHSPPSLAALAEAAERLQVCYGAKPESAACDLHPDYASTRYAEALGLPLIRVQHHHAHVVACMAEHGLEGTVLGVAWDGSGYGPDGTVWGGEFLRATRGEFQRLAHLRTFPLPGGEAAVREPRRTALGLLYETQGPKALEDPWPGLGEAFSPGEWKALGAMLGAQVRCPRSSSVGRLFDAVAALIGLKYRNNFEGQSAMLLEFSCEATDDNQTYPFPAGRSDDGFVMDWEPMLRYLWKDMRSGVAAGTIAGRFHRGLAEGLRDIAGLSGERRVVLSGGCFQNKVLLEASVKVLREAGHEVFWPRKVPPNDGGISLGQAAVAAAQERS